MDRQKKIGAGLAVAAVLALGAGGVAYAVGGEGNESVAGADADRAAQAALDATSGGEVLEVEAADDGAEGYEVEIKQPDDAVVEVSVDPGFSVTATTADDGDQGEVEREGADD